MHGWTRALAAQRAFAVQIVVGLLALAGAQALQHGGLLDTPDDIVEAWRSSIATRPATGRVAVAAIDGRSLERVGRWPWPRDLHARAIDNLASAGAEAILFDVDFSAPSEAGSDAALAAAIARADGRVTLPIFRRDWTSDRTAPGFTTLSKPLPALAENAWLAAVNVEADADGILRVLPRADAYGTNTGDVPSLSAALAEAGPGPPIRVDFSIDQASVPTLSYVDIVDGSFDRSRVEGRRIVIGATATELRDDVSVPRHGNLPGVMLHVLGAETVMQERELRALPAWRTGVLVGVMLLTFAIAGHNAFNVYLFMGLMVASLAALEGFAAFAFTSHAVSAATAQFHVQALLTSAGVAITNLEKVRSQLSFARGDAADGDAILSRVIDRNPSGILIVNRDGGLLRMNGSARDLLEIDGTQGDEQDFDLAAALGAELARIVEDSAAGTGATATGHVERGVGPSARILEYAVAPTPLSKRDGSEERVVLCITLNDVTQRERAHALARYQADHDSLTDLFSRYAALRRLAKLEAQPPAAGLTAVVVFDLDRFGAVNEAHGYAAADKLLCEVANRLRDWSEGDFVARLGSDEFLIVATREDRARLDRALTGLRDLVGRPVELRNGSVTCTATLGVAEASADARQLLKRANAALRKAKATPAPCIFHDEELERASRRHSLIDAALPVSIAAEELSVVFQPQLDLRSNRIKGAEALVRWTHPELGFVSPAEFIPIAEVTGQIVTLGEWVMRQACRRAATWAGRGERRRQRLRASDGREPHRHGAGGAGRVTPRPGTAGGGADGGPDRRLRAHPTHPEAVARARRRHRRGRFRHRLFVLRASAPRPCSPRSSSTGPSWTVWATTRGRTCCSAR